VIWHDDYGFDRIKPPMPAAIRAVPAGVPIAVGRYSLAPGVALYTHGRLSFALKNSPRVDYVGLWALPPGQPVPLAPRIAVFDLCSASRWWCPALSGRSRVSIPATSASSWNAASVSDPAPTTAGVTSARQPS
jgi:hypothetical protein